MTDAVRTARAPGRQPARSVLILVAALASVAAGYLQMALHIGQTPQEFSADSDSTLRIASWAFGIWALIYAGLVTYAVWQALPGTPSTPFLRRMAWPSFMALFGIGAWIFAAALDLEYLTIALIVASAAVLIRPLWAAGPEQDGASGKEKLLAATPLTLLAGWLTIASAANILTVLTGNGLLPDVISPTGWATAAIAVVALIAVAVMRRTRLWVFALPISWGLAGAWAAEQARNPNLAWIAAGFGFALLVYAAAIAVRKRA